MISRILRGVFLLFLIGGFSLLFSRLAPRQDPPGRQGPGSGDRTEGDAHLEGLRYLEWKGGALAWVMEARSAEFFYMQERSAFEDVQVTFFAPAGEKILLSARQVRYRNEDRTLTAEGRVSLEDEQGYRFSADTISYDAKEKELSTRDKVTLERDRLLIEGTGLEGSLVDQRFTLLSGVKAVFAPGRMP